MAPEQAAVSRGRKISAVWFIPLLALALGVYMVVHSLLTEGPEIEIAFATANGLEEGKTQIRYRDVEMGVVQSVRLNDDFDGVIATAKLDRQALPLLREETRFWVVTAQVGVDNISGLDTLLSGAYIQLSPGPGEEGRRQFEALENPPLTPADADGLRLKLTSGHAASLSAGDAVLHKGYKVGRIDGVRFDPQQGLVHYDLFIDAPYHTLVNSAVRFWDVSGISVSAGADGVQVRTGSLETVLLGGVAFGVPEGVRDGDPVEQNTEFSLYDSYEDILKNPHRYGSHYVVRFKQSVKGLQPGAPVEFRGIQIGRVERLLLKESVGAALHEGGYGKGIEIPVLIYVEPARLELPDKPSSLQVLKQSVATGVDNGMRASLETGNLLTGAKYVNIDYFPGAEPAALGTFLEYPVLPTVDTGFGHLQQQVSSILEMLADLPLDQTVADANRAIASLDDLLVSANGLLAEQGTRQLPDELNTTLQELRGALHGLSPGSDVYESINSSLRRLNRTLGNLEAVTGTLAAQPNAAVLPSTAAPDPVPEVSE